MIRLKETHDEPHENHERWLVSYADFITLMFAFFVVMYASSQADKVRAQALSDAVDKALTEGKVPSRVRQLFHGKQGTETKAPVMPPTLAKLDSPLEELRNALKSEIANGSMDVHMEGRGLVISLKQAAFFPSGDATVTDAGYPAIEKVAVTLQKIPNPVRLEGHTDSIPISNGKFRNNWELSTARSVAMLELLNSRFHIPEPRLAAVGYGDTVAVDRNDTPEGRARNRRVDITVLNDDAFSKEPRSRVPNS